MPLSKECIELANEALSRFTYEELTTYANKVFKKAAELGDKTGTDSVEEAIKWVNDKETQALFEHCKVTANNTLKVTARIEEIKNKTADVRSQLVRRYNNLSNNVESSQRAAKQQLASNFFKNITKEEFSYFSDKNNDEDVARAFDGKDASPLARSLAKKLKEYIEYRNAETVLSDALTLSEIRMDRFLKHNHNQTKMINGQKSLVASAHALLKKHEITDAKELWVRTIKPLLNLKDMFSETDAVDDLFGTIDDAKVDEILRRSFDNITTGKSTIFTKSGVMNDREAVRRKRQMFFIFKDMESFSKYNSVYGTGDLFTALRSDIEGSGNRIGMAKILGDNPHGAYLDLTDAQRKYAPHGNLWYKHNELFFKEVMGENKAAVSPKLATFASNVRSLTTMARLLKITIQSLSDLHAGAVFAKRWGYSYWSSYGEFFKNSFNLIPSEERSYVAELFKFSVDNHLGYIGKFIDANTTGELMSKATNQYFRKLGMEALDKGNKVSILSIMSRHLANHSHLKLADLPKAMQLQLNKFGLTEAEWDLLRKKNTRLQSGQMMFTTDNVNALTADELKSLYENSDKSVPLYELKNNLFRKVHAIFDVAAENAVISPGAWTRAWVTGGFAPGTGWGELMRTITQFKSYAITYMDRVLAQGWRDSEGVSGKMLWATQMATAVLPLSYMSMMFDNFAKGLTPPDPSLMSASEQEQFWMGLLMPSLGVFLGILDPDNQDSDLVLSLFASPTTRLLSNTAAVGLALGRGDTKAAGKSFGKMANYMAPIQSPPFLGPYLDAALGREAYLQPGQEHIYGK